MDLSLTVCKKWQRNNYRGYRFFKLLIFKTFQSPFLLMPLLSFTRMGPLLNCLCFAFKEGGRVCSVSSLFFFIRPVVLYHKGFGFSVGRSCILMCNFIAFTFFQNLILSLICFCWLK